MWLCVCVRVCMVYHLCVCECVWCVCVFEVCVFEVCVCMMWM